MSSEVVNFAATDGEASTGFSTFVTMGTSTSDLGEYTISQPETYSPNAPATRRVADPDEVMLPETREEQFLDRTLAEFYRRRGY